jgi:hypothetical protein
MCNRHRTDELLVEQHTVSDGQAASPVKKRATVIRCELRAVFTRLGSTDRVCNVIRFCCGLEHAVW